MSTRPDEFAYMMAAEKVVNLAFNIEQALNFFEEYGITPDNEVKKALNPLILNLTKWLQLGNLPVNDVIR
jgi:hypothetical protein